jgi:DNA processing protein
MVTVSGLAYGIDSEVARETLNAGGKTIAVLGHGLAMMYPKHNAKLADEIVEQGGLILSEFPLDEQPTNYTFPARNRIIAGLSLATVVIEASKDSGSLITADLALEYGRDVFAVPGDIFDPTFEGSHALIAGSRAKLVTSAQDILRELGVVAPEARTKDSDAAFDSIEEELLYHALTTMPQSPDDLSTKIKLDAAIMSATLTVLELKGLVKNVGGGRWVKG